MCVGCSDLTAAEAHHYQTLKLRRSDLYVEGLRHLLFGLPCYTRVSALDGYNDGESTGRRQCRSELAARVYRWIWLKCSIVILARAQASSDSC